MDCIDYLCLADLMTDWIGGCLNKPSPRLIRDESNAHYRRSHNMMMRLLRLGCSYSTDSIEHSFVRLKFKKREENCKSKKPNCIRVNDFICKTHHQVRYKSTTTSTNVCCFIFLKFFFFEFIFILSSLNILF